MNDVDIFHIFPLNIQAQEKLQCYLEMIHTWNKALNLTGYKDKSSFMDCLAIDSFYLADFLNRFEWQNESGLEICDLGAGAGLPGIPLRLIWQKGHYNMIEARQKRALFLANAVARLNLPNTSIFRGRAEDFFRNNKPSRCILSRAFMPWQKLISFCVSILARDGVLIIFAHQKCKELPKGWRLKDQYDYKVKNQQRWFWALEKDD